MVHRLRLPWHLDLARSIGPPLSPAVISNGLVWISGYVSLDPTTGRLSPGTIEHETTNTLLAVQRVLDIAGATYDDAVKVNLFLADIDRDFASAMRIYKLAFGRSRPALTVTQAKINFLLKVEMDLVASV